MVTWCGYDEPDDVLEALDAKFTPDLDAYAAGEIDLTQVRCLMCETAPCRCATDFPFGSPQYLARTREIHHKP
jgi:hypothetical protein